MFEYYKIVLSKYTTFTGRARRAEYWYFVLMNTIISVTLIFVDISAGTYNEETGNGIIGSIYSFAVIIPSIAVGVRRMHDVGKSGWFLLIPIYNLILAATEGEKTTNEYGPDPKSNELDIEDHLI